jgi:hypothetical protein
MINTAIMALEAVIGKDLTDSLMLLTSEINVI